MIICVFICSYSYDPAALSSWVGNFLRRHNINYTGVVVCNGKHALPENDSTWSYINGTNRSLDFGAYMEAVEHLISINFNLYLILNDTLLLRHNGRKHLAALLKYKDIVSESGFPVIAGKTDDYNTICYANPWSKLPVYVSTFCFLINGHGINYIRKVNEVADTFFEGVDVLNPNVVNLDPNVRSFMFFLDAHLRFPGTSISWYRLSDNVNDLDLLRKKARCVFMEHRLSGFLGEHGEIISVYNTAKEKTLFFINEQTAKLKRLIFAA